MFFDRDFTITQIRGVPNVYCSEVVGDALYSSHPVWKRAREIADTTNDSVAVLYAEQISAGFYFFPGADFDSEHPLRGAGSVLKAEIVESGVDGDPWAVRCHIGDSSISASMWNFLPKDLVLIKADSITSQTTEKETTVTNEETNEPSAMLRVKTEEESPPLSTTIPRSMVNSALLQMGLNIPDVMSVEIRPGFVVVKRKLRIGGRAYLNYDGEVATCTDVIEMED